MKMMKNVLMIIILLVVMGLIMGVCYGYYKKATLEVKNPIATMEVEGFGTVKIELYPEQAPNTVANFTKLANNGYYNGLKFHRIVKDFMIQGGDSKGDGTGSVTLGDLNGNENEEEYSIKGEFIANGHNNLIKHEEGVISMARADYSSYSPTLAEEGYNSAGSQFFIMTENNTYLNGYYAAFGKVIEGMDIINKIEDVEIKEPSEEEQGAEKSEPVNPPVIKSITVETFGIDYGTPETQKPFDYTSMLYGNGGMY